MPAKKEDIPSTLERSPKKVRDTYEEALDSAARAVRQRGASHRTAWSAVKHVAEKKGDRWETRGREGPVRSPGRALRPRCARGPRERRPCGVEPANKSKDELMQDAREADIEGRSRMNKDELVDALRRHNDRETAKAR